MVVECPLSFPALKIEVLESPALTDNVTSRWSAAPFFGWTFQICLRGFIRKSVRARG